MKVLYIPLDERPCNYKYPRYLADLTDDVELLVPPPEYLGKVKKPCDVDKLWNWTFDNIEECSYAIMSVDTMVYGNLINSRIHHKTPEQCENYLNNFIKLKEKNPGIEIHAYNLVARVASGNSDTEDPDYWNEYGYNIWRYGYIDDKLKSGKASEADKQELEDLTELIPQEYMEDFLDRRRTNHFVNTRCIELTRDGVINDLVIPKDDCSEFGFAAMEQKLLSKIIYENRIMDHIMVYPGTDEVGCVLFTRVFNKYKKYIPRVLVKYSSTLGGTVIPRYEDRPLNESIKYQITSVGGIMVTSALESDLLLAVHSPGQFMIESAEQYYKDISFVTYANVNEFIKYALYYSNTYKRPYAIADVAFSNGSDNEFMVFAKQSGLFDSVCSYGGWNTSENSIGVALAHGIICSYYDSFKDSADKLVLSMEFLMRSIISDWLLLSNVTHVLGAMQNDYPQIDYYHVGENGEFIRKMITDMIAKLLEKEFDGIYMGRKIVFENLSLPWDRIFEIDFNFKLL